MPEWQPDSILRVEDLVTDARLMERSIKKAGISNPVVIVTDGQQAIDYLSQASQSPDPTAALPAIVFLDLKIPRRDGFEVLAWIRQQACLADLPVVILTSSSRMPDERRAIELGANL